MTLKLNVTGDIRIKRRIIVDGREYSSVEELPEGIRRAYDQAMANVSREVHGNDSAGPQTRVVFNGEQYGGLDEMPEDIRRLYDDAIAAVEAHGSTKSDGVNADETAPAPLGPGGTTSTGLPSMAPIEVGGGSSSSVLRLVIAAIVVLMLLGALYFFSRLPW